MNLSNYVNYLGYSYKGTTYVTIYIYPKNSHQLIPFGDVEYRYDDGGRYVGRVKDGNKHGRGKQIWINPTESYEGDWRGNQRHGRGVYRWSNGNRYEGDFRNNERTGNGVYVKANGDRCAGEWRNNKLVGVGAGMERGKQKLCYPLEKNFSFRR